MGKLLFQVIIEAVAIVWRVQEAIDIIKDGFPSDISGVAEAPANILQYPVCNAISTLVFWFIF